MKAVKKVWTFTCKINKYDGCNVQHDKCIRHCCMLHMKLLRVNPKTSHHKKKYIFFSVSLILYLNEMLDVHWTLWQSFHDICKPNHHAVHLKLTRAVSQLYLNNTGRGKKSSRSFYWEPCPALCWESYLRYLSIENDLSGGNFKECFGRM